MISFFRPVCRTASTKAASAQALVLLRSIGVSSGKTFWSWIKSRSASGPLSALADV
jgi:hypothetical protein